MVTSPRRKLEPSVGTHGNVGRRLRIAGDQRSLTQRRWVIHRTKLDRLPRRDIVKIVGDTNHPILTRQTRSSPLGGALTSGGTLPFVLEVHLQHG